MPSPWYSKADEHPRGEMRLRAGETYIKAFILTQVDPDTLADIAAKDFTNYASLYATFANPPGSTPIVTTGADQVTVQGDADQGTLRIVVLKAQTQALWDALQGASCDCCVWGTDQNIADSQETDGVRDLLWTATAAVLPSSS